MIAGQTPTNGTSSTPETPQWRPPLNGRLDPGAAEFVHRAQWKATVLGTLNVLFVVLSIRLTLVIAVIGSIILASTVVAAPDPWRLGALAIYAIVVVLPMIGLAARK